MFGQRIILDKFSADVQIRDDASRVIQLVPLREVATDDDGAVAVEPHGVPIFCLINEHGAKALAHALLGDGGVAVADASVMEKEIAKRKNRAPR